MSRFAPKTLRRMPPATREIARLANELASVQTRLANRIGGRTEMMARASERVFCSNAALGYFRAVDNPKARGRSRGRPGKAHGRRNRRRAGA